MSRSVLSSLLLLVAVAGWCGVAALRRGSAQARSAASGRTAFVLALQFALVLLALFAHLNILRMPANVLLLGAPKPHYHDLLHYYLGTKYFPELGYTGLYSAIVLADSEDARATADPNGPVRDLSTNQVKPRARAVEAAMGLPVAFGPERWSAFKREVAFFRGAIPPERWRTLVADHGYNGTPLVTALLGSIAHQGWLPTRLFLSWASTADFFLIAAFALFLAVREGGALAAAFLFFTFANPLNEYGFVGGSYVRYGYFVALAAGLWALRARRLAASGVWLALAGWMRIFPLAIYGFVLLRDLAGPGWRERLRSNARLHVAFAVATLAVLGATSLAVPAPGGRNPWLAFADKITAHADSPGINQVFLAIPLSYSRAVDRLQPWIRNAQPEANPEDAASDWSSAAAAKRRERAPVVYVVAAALVGLSIVALRRTSGAEVLLPALLAVFCVMPMTSYDWVVLSLVPLAWRNGPAAERGVVFLLFLFAAVAATGLRSLQVGIDLRYTLISAEVLVFLMLSCAVSWQMSAVPGAPGQSTTT